jgi:hypothetical protein
MLDIKVSVQYTHHALRSARTKMENSLQLWCSPSASLVPVGGNACDFCNHCPAVKIYPCGNFELHGLTVFRNGNGAFAACEQCAAFIDAEKWSSLAERAFQKFMKHHSVPRHSVIEVRVQFADLVRLFASHRKSES